MNKIAAIKASAALLSVAALTFPAPGQAQGERRVSRCELTVEGRTYIRGPCTYAPNGTDGSFVITEIARRPYFAYLLVDGEAAYGHWNETRGAERAHTDLGRMWRRGACWQNRRARICAWQ